jgi:hypothetical protein
MIRSGCIGMKKVNAPVENPGCRAGSRYPRRGALIIGFVQRLARMRHVVTDLHVGTDRRWTEPWTRSLHNPAFAIESKTES